MTYEELVIRHQTSCPFIYDIINIRNNTQLQVSHFVVLHDGPAYRQLPFREA